MPVQRSASLDALRVLGLIAVVVGHVWADETRLSIYTWHVPLFFFLSGYLWKEGRSVRSELSKRSSSLLVPMLAWGGVLLVLVLALMFYQRSFSAAAVWEDIQGGEFHTKPFMVFWFVLVLFFVSVLMRALEIFPGWVSWVVAAIGIAIACVDGPALAATPAYFGLTFPCLFFALCGLALRKLRAKFSLPVGLSMMAVSIGLIAAGISEYIDIKPGMFGTPVLSVAVAVAICAGLVIAFERILFSQVASKAVSTLASASMAVVLGHAVVLAFTQTFHPAVTLAACLFIPWSIGLVAIRTPFSRLVTGMPRKWANSQEHQLQPMQSRT